MALEAGQRLGAYEILGSIASGGMGEVYRARDTRLGREVAIKVLPERIARDANAVARFDREARAVAALSHPNILSIHDFGSEDGAVYAVTELLHGETLRERLAGGALPPRKAVELARLTARGLAAAHDKGIVHRDLKPENIFVTQDGGVKILDFGLAVIPDAPEAGDAGTPTRTSLTHPGTVMGTVGYMSPEQVRGEEADARSDIFSLGTVFYEMLTGKRAFLQETGAETMTAILREDPEEFSTSGMKVSPALASVVRRCMEKRPDERFHSARDLAFALEAMRDTSSAAHQAVETVTPTSERRGPSWPVALTLALLLAAGAFFAGRLLTPAASVAAPVVAQLTRLTHDAGAKGQPSVTADGTSFVYVVQSDDDIDILFQRIGGETAVNLTADHQGLDAMPAISPDGQQIAFVSDRDGGGVFVMGATGESVRRLTDFGANPTWDPDGRSLVIGTEAIYDPMGRSGISELWRVEVTSGETTKIETNGKDAAQPSVSPNGLRIAFWGLPEGTGKRVLYTVAAGGGEPLALTDDGFLNWNPVWSGDGRWLYFASDRGGWMNVWRLPIDESSGELGGAPEPVTLSTQLLQQFDVRPGTGNIVMAVSSRVDRIDRLPFDLPGRKVTGEAETVFESSRSISTTVVSPDGKWIVFVGLDPQEDLFIVGSDGSGLRRLTNDPHRDRSPRWTKDSQRIVFFSDRAAGRYEIWSLGRDGGNLTQVTETEGTNPYEPRISPDGKRLVVHFFPDSTGFADFSGELPIREFERLPPIGDGSLFFARNYSPDGSRLVGYELSAGGKYNPGLIVYDVEQQSYSRVFEEATGSTEWLPNSRQLLIGTEDGVYVLDIESGERQTVAGLEADRWLLSRDGRSIFTVNRRAQDEIWLLERDEN